MITRPCRANIPALCRTHGTPAKIAKLSAEAEKAAASGDISKYFDIKDRITTLEKIVARISANGIQPRDAVHPVLVYGTLRPTGSNYGRFMKGFTTAEQNVEIEGFTMYDGRGFPFLTKGENKVTATLVYLNDEDYAETMENLDHLEGFRDDDDDKNGYDRVLQTVEINGKQETAWLYVASSSMTQYAEMMLPVIDEGDWIEHDNSRVVQSV